MSDEKPHYGLENLERLAKAKGVPLEDILASLTKPITPEELAEMAEMDTIGRALPQPAVPNVWASAVHQSLPDMATYPKPAYVSGWQWYETRWERFKRWLRQAINDVGWAQVPLEYRPEFRDVAQTVHTEDQLEPARKTSCEEPGGCDLIVGHKANDDNEFEEE